MKRLFLSLCLLAASASTAVLAQPIALSVPDTAGTAGTQIRVPVRVASSLSGAGVYSYEFTLSYYDYVVTAVSVDRAGTVSEAMGSFQANVSTPGRIRVAAAGSAPLEGSGVLFYVTLSLRNLGHSALQFASDGVNRLNEGEPPLELTNGSISIQAAPTIFISPNQDVLTVGDALQFSASGTEGSLGWTLTNPAVASIDANGLLTATGVGTTRVIVEDGRGVRDTTNGVVEIRGFRLSIRDTAEYKGAAVDVPVYTSDLSGLGVLSGSFDLDYNRSLLKLVEVKTDGALLAGSDVTFAENSQGARIAFASTSALPGSGVLLHARFELSSENSGRSNLGISDITFNEALIGNADGGSLNVIAPSALSVSVPSATVLTGESMPVSVTGAQGALTWSVTDTSLASISEDGVFTALKGGTVQVQVRDAIGAMGLSRTIEIFDLDLRAAHVFAEAGDTVLVPVSFATRQLAEAASIRAFEGRLTFSGGAAQALGIVTAGSLSDGWSVASRPEGNALTFAVAGTQAAAGDTTLFFVRMAVAADAAEGARTYIAIGGLVLNEGSPLPLLSGGSLTVVVREPLIVNVSATTLMSGESMQATVSGAQGDLTWSVTDTAKASISEDGVFMARRGGTVRVKVSDAIGAVGESQDITIYDLAVDLGATVTAEPGDTVLVGAAFLYHQLAVRTPIQAFQGTITFDSTVARAVDVVMEGGLADSWSITTTPGENSLTFSGAGMPPSPADTVLFSIQMVVDSSAAEGSQTAVGLEGFVLNEGAPIARVTGGALTVRLPVELPPLNVSLPTTTLLAGESMQISVDNAQGALTWSVTDTARASISAEGVLTAKNGGTVQVRARDAAGATGMSEVITIYDLEVRVASVSARAGDTVLVPVAIPAQWSAAAASIQAFEGRLAFDGNVLQVLSLETAGSLSQGWSVATNPGENALTFAGAGTQAAAGDTTLFFVRVAVGEDVAEGTQSEIRIEGLLLNEGSLVAQVASGTLTVMQRVAADSERIPEEGVLLDNYPNPFNRYATVSVALSDRRHVSVEVFDGMGRRVARLADELLPSGVSRFSFDAADLPSGVYYCRVTAGEHVAIRKMLLVR